MGAPREQIADVTAPLLAAGSLDEVLSLSAGIGRRLQRLGIATRVDVGLDVAGGADGRAGRDGVEARLSAPAAPRSMQLTRPRERRRR